MKSTPTFTVTPPPRNVMALGAHFPQPPRAGEPLAASWGAAVVRALWGLRLIAGTGIKLEETPRGVIVSAKTGAASGRSDTSAPDHPFKIVQAGALSVSIVYGSVNGVGATTGDDANDGTITPTPTLTLTSGLNNIYVEAVWDGAAEPMAFLSCAVRVGDTPAPSDDSCAFGIGSAFVDAESGAVTINQGVTHSLIAERYKCGTSAPNYYWGGV